MLTHHKKVVLDFECVYAPVRPDWQVFFLFYFIFAVGADVTFLCDAMG